VGSGEVIFASQELKVHFNHFQLTPDSAQGDTLDFSILSKKVDLADPLAEAGRAKIAAKRLNVHFLNSFIKTDIFLEADLRKIESALRKMEVPDLKLSLTGLTLAGDQSPRSPQVENWWLKVSVKDALLDSGEKPDFSGKAKISSLDGKPLAILLKNAKVLPINLAGVIPMHDLQAETSFNFSRGSFRFDEFRLQSSTLQGNGHLEIRGKEKFGTLAVKSAVHSFQIDFKGKDSHLKW
jgi:hypothetical protein